MTSLKFTRGTQETSSRVFHVAVVGIVSNEAVDVVHQKIRGNGEIYRSHDLLSSETGPGKSCLCNRFVRPAEDQYEPAEHTSVISAADYSTTPINNDHFLYWGEARRTSDDGHDCVFSVIEQTEFIDDSTFQPFRNGKGDRDYVRRVTNTKIHSPGKIQYFGKSQLGIEHEFPVIPMPDGRFNVDGFLCTFDVCASSNKPLNRQVETTFQLLCQIVRQKKAAVLVTTKTDESDPSYLNEATKLLHRKELKGSVQLVETSARRNVNVDAAFMLLGQIIERISGHTQLVRYRLQNYEEAASMRKERMDTAAKAFEALVRTQIKDRRMTWPEAVRRFENDQDFKFFCELWGTESAKGVFIQHMRQLRDREAKSRLSIYLSRLNRIFSELLPSLSDVNRGWHNCVDYLRSLPVYESYFADLIPSSEHDTSGPINFLDDDGFYDSEDARVPSKILLTTDAERCFNMYANSLRREERRLRLCNQFVTLLNETPYALPGRTFRDVCVFLATEPAYTEELNELNIHEKQEIYESHQRKVIEDAKENFCELLLENVHLFLVKHENLKHRKRKKESDAKEKTSKLDKHRTETTEIENFLRSDRRYRAMDLLGSIRDSIVHKMWLYYHSLVPETCGTRSGCFDVSVRGLIHRSVRTPDTLPAFTMCSPLSPSALLVRIVVLGKNNLADNYIKTVQASFGDRLQLDGCSCSIDFRAVNGEAGWPQDAFRAGNYFPHGCFCVYDSKESFQYMRNIMEKDLNPIVPEESSENMYENGSSITPCRGLPTAIVFRPGGNLKETEMLRLRECGQDLVAKLQCAFVEVARNISTECTTGPLNMERKEEVVLSHLKTLIRDIQARCTIAKNIADGTLVPDLLDCDMRIRICFMCGDHLGGFAHHILSPLISHTICYHSGKNPQGFLLESYISDDNKIRLDVDCKSYHESLRLLNPNICDGPARKSVDGYVFAVTVKRKASYRNMRCLADMLIDQNSPRSCMVIAVLDHSSGPSVEEKQIITEVENICHDRDMIFVVTSISDSMPITTYTPLLRNCWDLKISTYDRASTATLSSTIPSLSDEEAVLIKSRSLDRAKYEQPSVVVANQQHRNSHIDTFGLDSPTFTTFGIGRNSVTARGDTNTSDDLVVPTSRLAIAETHALRVTRSTEDILACPNGRTSPGAALSSGAAVSQLSIDDDDDLPRPSHILGQRKSVPTAWQAKSTDGGIMEREKSSAHRFVGKLAAAGKYASFMDQLNATVARGTQVSPTAPLALPELVEDHEHEPPADDSWDESAFPVRSPGSDRQLLLGLRKRARDARPPDCRGFRRVVPPVPLPSQHLSLSQEDSETAVEDQYSGRSRDAPRNGIKPAKPAKPKREKEHKSLKKSKEKKQKKADLTFESLAQSADNPIPLFIEMCINFIDSRGSETEGVYRVSGSRVLADQLLAKFLSNPSSIDLVTMDVPIANVTTALKAYMTEQTPPVIPQSFVDELHDLNFTKVKSDRILMIKTALAHLSATHFQLLKYIFAHLRRLSEHCRKNKMDANNLTVCLWPTLCPIEIPNDMAGFEGLRVEISEIISTMITEYDKIFEPNYSCLSPSSTAISGSTSSPHMGALAQEAAEAARQRGTRNLSGPRNVVSGSQTSPQRPSAPAPQYPPPVLGSNMSTSSLEVNGGPSSILVKSPVLSSLKSVQV